MDAEETRITEEEKLTTTKQKQNQTLHGQVVLT